MNNPHPHPLIRKVLLKKEDMGSSAVKCKNDGWGQNDLAVLYSQLKTPDFID